MQSWQKQAWTAPHCVPLHPRGYVIRAHTSAQRCFLNPETDTTVSNPPKKSAAPQPSPRPSTWSRRNGAAITLRAAGSWQNTSDFSYNVLEKSLSWGMWLAGYFHARGSPHTPCDHPGLRMACIHLGIGMEGLWGDTAGGSWMWIYSDSGGPWRTGVSPATLPTLDCAGLQQCRSRHTRPNPWLRNSGHGWAGLGSELRALAREADTWVSHMTSLSPIHPEDKNWE